MIDRPLGGAAFRFWMLPLALLLTLGAWLLPGRSAQGYGCSGFQDYTYSSGGCIAAQGDVCYECLYVGAPGAPGVWQQCFENRDGSGKVCTWHQELPPPYTPGA